MNTPLHGAYAAIFLAFFRHEITREERDARVVALRDGPGAGLTFDQRNAIANEAVEYAASIIDEVYFSPSQGKWQ